MDASAKLMLRICPGEGEMVQTSLRSMAQLWETQQSKAGNSQEPGPAIASAPSSRHLGIRFSPVVAFVVSCKLGETKPADQHRKDGRNSMNVTRCLAADLRHSLSEALGNSGALSPS